MADQVKTTSSLPLGLPLALSAAAVPRPTPEKPRQAKVVDRPPQGQSGQPAVEATQNPSVAIEQLNSHLQQAGSELQFQVDKTTGRTVFKVINQSNGTVVLQVPSEEAMAMARNLRALGKQSDVPGVLVDKEG